MDTERTRRIVELIRLNSEQMDRLERFPYRTSEHQRRGESEVSGTTDIPNRKVVVLWQVGQ